MGSYHRERKSRRMKEEEFYDSESSMGSYHREKKSRRMKGEGYSYSESSKPFHPFSQSIISARLPEGMKIPKMEPYDGLTDPEDHLALFNFHMLFYGSKATDSIQCRAFPCTLRNHALKWFTSLPSNSINNFSELSSKFLSHFVLSKKFPKFSECLDNLKQGDDELLGDYIDRFNREALQVHDDDLSPKVIMKGLKSGRFLTSLELDKPSSLKELWERAQGYVNYEILLLHSNKRRRY